MSGIMVPAAAAPAVSAKGQAPVQIGDFDGNTRKLRVPLPPILAQNAGTLINIPLPRNGFLAGIGFEINATTTGAPGTPNPIGQACMLRNIRLFQGGGNATIDITGPGYFYALAYMFELGQDMAAYTTARSAVAAGASILDVYLPVTPNLRDAVGLINLQSRQTTWTAQIQLETNAVIGVTTSVTVFDIYPYLEIFTAPDNPINNPQFTYLQRILEDIITYTGATQKSYAPLVGDTFLQLAHLVGGDLVTAVDNFSDATLRFNQSSYVQTLLARQLDIVWQREHLKSGRPKGLILYDWVAQAGLGNYDKLRDVVDSQRVSDFESLFTMSVAGPLNVRNIRRTMAKVNQ